MSPWLEDRPVEWRWADTEQGETRYHDVSFLRSARDNRPEPWRLSFYQLAARLSVAPVRATKDGPAWSPTRYPLGARRAKGAVEEVSLLVLDLDSGGSLDEAWTVFEGPRLMHTTWSHTTEQPRARLIVVPSRPIPAEDYPRAWQAAARRCLNLGVAVDQACKDPSRLYYLPARASEESPFEVRYER